MPTFRKAIAFSMPPELAEQAQQMVRKEGRDMSELLRDVLRLYLAEREWLRQERHQLARVRRNERQKAQAGRTDE